MSAFILTIFCSNIHAQGVKIGAKAGLNLSTIAGDVPESFNPRFAYHFGGFANFSLSDSFSINPELLYFSIGNTYDFSFSDFRNFDFDPIINQSFKSVQRDNFIAIPINFRYNFTDRFGLDFGPQVSFLLNSVSKLKESTNLENLNDKTSNSGNFRPDYGANIGFTFSLNDKINFQLRYYQGLKNLTNSEFFPDEKSFNVALQLSAGYVIF